ncbi:SETMR methyltransferase, partial [Acromyrmex charruanus]
LQNEKKQVSCSNQHMKGLMPKEIKVELDNVHSTFATVYNWVNEFNFWDARGIIHIDYLPSKQTAKKKVLFLQDNARIHTCLAPMAKFNEFRYELLLHPAYSPDFAPYDYFLFPNLKKWFGGKRFITREQLIAEIEAYFERVDKSYYSDGLKKLENCWIKCIEK